MSAEIKNSFVGKINQFIQEIPDNIKNSGRFQFIRTTNPCLVLILHTNSLSGTVYNFKDKESADKFYDFVNNPRVRYTYYSRVGRLCGGVCPWELFEEIAETYDGTYKNIKY